MSADDKGPIEWTLPGAISFRLHVETWDGLGPHHQRPATVADIAAAGYVPAADLASAKAELQQLYAAFTGSAHSPKNPREAKQAIEQMSDGGFEAAGLELARELASAKAALVEQGREGESMAAQWRDSAQALEREVARGVAIRQSSESKLSRAEVLRSCADQLTRKDFRGRTPPAPAPAEQDRPVEPEQPDSPGDKYWRDRVREQYPSLKEPTPSAVDQLRADLCAALRAEGAWAQGVNQLSLAHALQDVASRLEKAVRP